MEWVAPSLCEYLVWAAYHSEKEFVLNNYLDDVILLEDLFNFFPPSTALNVTNPLMALIPLVVGVWPDRIPK